MDKTKRLTLEELIAKKEQRRAAGPAVKDVWVDGLEGCLVLRKIPVARYISIMGKYDLEDFAQALACEVELVYACCPMLQKESMTQDLAEPTDIVLEILDEDLEELGRLAAEVSGFYGMAAPADIVKN